MRRQQIIAWNSFLESVAVLMARIELRIKPLVKENKLRFIGHNEFKYHIDPHWGEPTDRNEFPVIDCHEMVIDANNRLYVLTNHPKNNILIYDLGGNIIDSWTLDFESAHGLTIANEGSDQYLFICDYKSGNVVKTTLQGQVVLTLPTPKELGIYKNPDRYLPTHTAVAASGDIYVADGYGSSYVIQYDSKGNYIRHFGGRGKSHESINSAHGIAIDNRSEIETVLVSSREDACFKRYTLDGQYINSIDLDGAYVCRPVVNGKNIYAAVCWSDRLYSPNTGFVLVLDENDQVVSAPGGIDPSFMGTKTAKFIQGDRVFQHCHDVCLDGDKNLYVCQWNARGQYPMKLTRLNSK